jgi:quercetin 2,3-dioxygenase
MNDGEALIIRRAQERGQTTIDWLDSRHTFAFGGYRDPAFAGYRSLRVINDDWIAPGGGFGEHGHRDMEILTWVLQGALRHQDSLGTGSVIVPGDVQLMTAGSGIRHSEFNDSDDQPVHLLQIWIIPSQTGLAPRYEQKHFDVAARQGRPCLIASPDGRDGSVMIHQDAAVYVSDLSPGQWLEYRFGPDRHGWLHVAAGNVTCNNRPLAEGDGVMIGPQTALHIASEDHAQVMLFDLN